jgi:negative regulator of sigma-B (phosphoserine phosphatase)
VRVATEFLSLPKDGEQVNGDAVVVRNGGDHPVMLAVIDALGHGAAAASVAAAATAYLGEAPLDRGVVKLVEGLHGRLRGSRGAAAMVLIFSGGRVEGCGVGNVEMRSVKRRVPVVLSPGVLGASLGKLHLFEAQLSAGDRLVVFSDGIAGRFDDELSRGLTGLETCRRIMDRHRRPHDDATVLVTDIEGS